MQLKATGNNLIIRPDPPIEKTEAGILIPVEAREHRNTGTVVDGDFHAANIQPKDRVAFNYRRGYEVEFAGETFLSIDKKFILSKL